MLAYNALHGMIMRCNAATGGRKGTRLPSGFTGGRECNLRLSSCKDHLEDLFWVVEYL
jgi:hypothetical protein